jgi:hypothetical protein
MDVFSTVAAISDDAGFYAATFSPRECRNFLRHAGYVQT